MASTEEKIKDEIKKAEAKYGYLPEEEKEEKHLLDEIIEWLKSKRSGYIDKLKKAL